MTIPDWLTVLTAGVGGYLAGHYRLKLRIFRNVARLTDEERVLVSTVFRAGKARATRGS